MSAKPLVGLEPLPHEAGAPVVEETPRPTLASVVPELAERLLQQASGVEPLVGSQQQRKRALAVQAEIVAMRQQRVLLALDEAPILAAQARVFGFAHLVEGLAEMAHDVGLVEQDCCLRCFVLRDVTERLPHVHHSEPYLAARGSCQAPAKHRTVPCW